MKLLTHLQLELEELVIQAALYTGIDGLSVYLAMGENNDQPLTGITEKSDLSAMAVTYAAGALTVGYQIEMTQVLQVKTKILQLLVFLMR